MKVKNIHQGVDVKILSIGPSANSLMTLSRNQLVMKYKFTVAQSTKLLTGPAKLKCRELGNSLKWNALAAMVMVIVNKKKTIRLLFTNLILLGIMPIALTQNDPR